MKSNKSVLADGAGCTLATGCWRTLKLLKPDGEGHSGTPLFGDRGKGYPMKAVPLGGWIDINFNERKKRLFQFSHPAFAGWLSCGSIDAQY